MLRLLFLCVILFVPGAFAGLPCEVMDTFDDINELSKKMAPVLSAAETENIPQFCQVNGLRDMLETAPDGNDRAFGWPGVFVAAKDYREGTFLNYFSKDQTTQANPLSAIPNKKEAYEKVQKHLQAMPEAVSRERQVVALRWLENAKGLNADQQSALNVGLAKASYICSDLTTLHLLGCAKGTNRAIEIARPVSNVALLPVWKDVFENPVYMKVFKKVSLKIVQNLKDGTVPASTLMDDLKQEFLAATHDKKKADDLAWNTMGLLATGGGNASSRAAFISGSSAAARTDLGDLLWVLSNGSTALDRLSAAKGFLYTYPKEVGNLCDYGKNYHFWMTAYLARQLRQENFDATSAATAAFTVQKGYQFAKLGGGRDPGKPFYEYLYSNYNNNIRLDLSLASAGAWYGASDGQGRGPSGTLLSREQVESGLRQNFKGSRPLAEPRGIYKSEFENGNALATAGVYRDWKTLINPDQAFQAFQSALGY